MRVTSTARGKHHSLKITVGCQCTQDFAACIATRFHQSGALSSSPNTFALIRATNKITQVHDRNKSTTQTHEETRKEHIRERACECKCAAAHPFRGPNPSQLSTRESLGNRRERARAVPKPPITMSSTRHVLLWVIHHNVINLSLIQKTEVWTIRHNVINPSRGF